MRVVKKRSDKEYKTIEEIKRFSENLKHLEKHNISIIRDKDALKLVWGLVCVSVGVVSIPIPSGSFLLIGLGLGLIGKSGYNIFTYRNIVYSKIRFYYWYMSRSLKGYFVGKDMRAYLKFIWYKGGNKSQKWNISRL